MTLNRKIVFTAINNIPLIESGNDLSEIMCKCVIDQKIQIDDGDIFIFAQKIISKAENRLVDLRDVKPGFYAKRIAKRASKDPRLVELIIQESNKVIRVRKGLIIVEHKNGFICANAGIDHSNSFGGSEAENYVLLLPENSDRSAQNLRRDLELRLGIKLGVLIIDSHGRAWRNGTLGTTIGLSGLPGLVDLRGKPDLFGYKLRVTQVAAADELAAGGSLLMGQADESTPCIHVSGFPYALRESQLSELIRLKKYDLFR